MQHVGLETSRQLRGIVHAYDALGWSSHLSSYFQGRQLGLRFHAFLADLHDVDAPGKSRLQEAFEIALLFPSVRAQVEPGEAEACLQAHQHSHEATIMAVTWLSALALGASQLPKIDRLLLVHHRTGSPIAKEPTVFNVMCLAIQ